MRSAVCLLSANLSQISHLGASNAETAHSTYVWNESLKFLMMSAGSIPSLQQSFSSLHAYWLDAGATGPLPSC